MQAYRCKCGKAKYFGSGMFPQACEGCEECGTTLAQRPGDHKPIEPHQHEIHYDDDGRPYERCTICHKRGRKFKKPLMLPGMQAIHAWITDECRELHGDDGAIGVVLDKLRNELEATMAGWIGRGVKIHIGMTVERAEDQ